MVTQLQPDVRAYLHGGEVIKRYIKVEEMAYEYGFSVEETEYIAKAAMGVLSDMDELQIRQCLAMMKAMKSVSVEK